MEGSTRRSRATFPAGNIAPAATGLARTPGRHHHTGPRAHPARITTVYYANAPLTIRMRARRQGLIPMEPHPNARAMARVSTRQRHPGRTRCAARTAATQHHRIARKALSQLNRHRGGPPFAYPRSQDPPPWASEGSSQVKGGGRAERTASTHAGADQGTRANVYRCRAHIARTGPRQPHHRMVRLAFPAACTRAWRAGTLGPAHTPAVCAHVADQPPVGARQQRGLLAVPRLRHLRAADMRSLIEPFHSSTFFTNEGDCHGTPDYHSQAIRS